MRIRTSAPVASPASIAIPSSYGTPLPRLVRPGDELALGALMFHAYNGTVDQEEDTLDQCVEEMRGTLAGKYGALASAGYSEFYLVVTEGNVSAERLYRRLGFELIGPALPKQQPPA